LTSYQGHPECFRQPYMHGRHGPCVRRILAHFVDQISFDQFIPLALKYSGVSEPGNVGSRESFPSG
jgi:hypothetical protein